MSEFISHNKEMELEINITLTLSRINLERLLDTHKIVHTEKLLRKQDMVIWDRHSVIFTYLGSGIISYASITP